MLAWTEDSKDPQYPLSSADLAILEKETDARGRKLIVHKVPVPGKPVCITEYELAGFSFEEGGGAAKSRGGLPQVMLIFILQMEEY